ncbi:MAG: kynureninase, partial [Dinghuibacter sp.]|nr:kynureninase [Dinghuibacter sp.]
MQYQNNREFAQQLDAADELKEFRNLFHIPRTPEGKEVIYFCGNSLGLHSQKVSEYVQQELNDWQTFGVEGHFHARSPWMPYHEFLTSNMAAVVGALPHEVVVMNTLTANLHFMMVSFYRPTPQRHKILIEWNP